LIISCNNPVKVQVYYLEIALVFEIAANSDRLWRDSENDCAFEAERKSQSPDSTESNCTMCYLYELRASWPDEINLEVPPMANKTMIVKPVAAAVGIAFLTSLAFSSTVVAEDNPFEIANLDSGYLMAGGDKGEDKGEEGKCGEGKCGGDKGEEGSCGEKGEEGSCGEESEEGGDDDGDDG
jgi:uncharacterized low-complexity protein